ncbi:NAD(P)H-hydrate epimerase [Hydrogenibacillus schlegelii]|uniref:Bifunctional NAD(P)H-hydrate repair enzyme n=1 Tax=Hydrogenibacillus schlegelii TaxID=1484 RepID=A0A179IQF8_HYDSH|nr:NAD(P)H-hydrate epimerase [Hydrogenibacillus schlegelii]OAR04916.1 hypothetical protein SA87_04335 [Hydrogenibacillus schlegelii]
MHPDPSPIEELGSLRPYGIRDVARWDENARWLGLLPLQLMENAGRAVADVIETAFPDARRIAVLAGPGNNGGDGFVAARHLARNRTVDVYLVGRPEEIRTPEAKHNFALIAASPHVRVTALGAEDDVRALRLEAYDLILDALLGAGLRGAPRGLMRAAIEAINRHRPRRPVVAVDLPSGHPHEPTVEADVAVTFEWDKREYAGFARIVRPIGFLPELAHLVGPADVRPHLMRRGAHKGENGDLLILAGSSRYPGAAALAALAAAPFVDRVFLARPGEAPPPSPAVIPVPLPDRPGGGRETFHPDDVALLRSYLEAADAVVLGPGLGRTPEALAFVRSVLAVLEALRRPHVVDADALYALEPSGSPGSERAVGPNASTEDAPSGGGADADPIRVLTPHGGEFRRLWTAAFAAAERSVEERTDLGSTYSIGPATPWADIAALGEATRRLAERWHAVVLRKGRLDMISDGRRWRYNLTGDVGLTAGGTGDVLAGLIGAFLARGVPPLEAAMTGAFLVGLTGETLARKVGPHYTAEAVAGALPEVTERVRRGDAPPRIASPFFP